MVLVFCSPVPGFVYDSHLVARTGDRPRFRVHFRSGWPAAASTYGCGSKSMVPFRVGAPPILIYFSGDWDVH